MKLLLLSATLIGTLALTACGTHYHDQSDRYGQRDRYERYERHDQHDRYDRYNKDNRDRYGSHHTLPPHKDGMRLQRTDVRVVNANAVKRCQHIGDISTMWSQTARSGWTGSEAARDDLQRRAHAVGATHIVLNGTQRMGEDTQERAKAYRCSK